MTVDDSAAVPASDVIVAGAGLAGLTAAACLINADASLQITIVDPRPELQVPDQQHCGLRVSAVTPASINLFERLGVWSQMPDTHQQPFSTMRVWDAGTDCGNGIVFDAAEFQRETLGAIADNTMLAWQLYRSLQAASQVRFVAGRIEAIRSQPDHIEVVTDHKARYRAALLIGADGRNSRVRDLAGMPVKGWAHHQQAVVGHLSSEREHECCALQRFLPDGPLALLPLPGNQVSLVLSTTPEKATALLSASDASFARHVTEASDAVLGDLYPLTPRASFPLISQFAEDPIALRIALVGDAAHAIHPLAGQGANLGFADAQCLAALIVAARNRGEHIGDMTVLRRYRRARKADNLGMLYGLDFINRLFAREQGAIADLRRRGMRWFQRSVVAKRLAASQAMGVSGDKQVGWGAIE